MKTILRLVAFALALAGFVLPGLGQDHRFYHPLTIAPAPAEPAAGGSGMQDEAEKQTQLLKDSLNPVAALISVPIQKDWDFGIGPLEGMRYTARVQPVIPFGLNKDWNLITRTILPIIYQESRFPGDGPHSGLSDTLQSFFFSPKKPVGGWVVGGGLVLLYPTATASALGTGKWGAGPTLVGLRQRSRWTYGMLVNHVWSYAGWGNTEVNATHAGKRNAAVADGDVADGRSLHTVGMHAIREVHADDLPCLKLRELQAQPAGEVAAEVDFIAPLRQRDDFPGRNALADAVERGDVIDWRTLRRGRFHSIHP